MIVMNRRLIAMAITLSAVLLGRQTAAAQSCVPDVFEQTNYVVCTADPVKADLRLFWKDANDRPYRTFSAVAEAVRVEQKSLTFAMNAGMYKPDFSPIGLYVEGGKQLVSADTKTLKGSAGQIPNFYKKPNGIFYLGKDGAGVLPTDAFAKAALDVTFATQSGPMLVIRNRLHPAFIAGSTDRTYRSGVGVCAGGQVRFAISRDKVNFHTFARLFRDHLQCPNALFFDGGNGSGIFSPQMNLNDISWHGGFGPMIGLIE